MIHFVLGGARSGKSRFAEQKTLEIANKKNKQAVYIATESAIDAEMAHRIAIHQCDRNEQGDSWQLIECPLALSDMFTELNRNSDSSVDSSSNGKYESKNVYLVDCLILWLNNQLYAKHDETIALQRQHLQGEIDKLIRCLEHVNNDLDIVIVSNEIGLGVIPMGESTRLYVDYCGWLNQGIAKVADKVTLVTAGIPLCIKGDER